MLWLSLKSISRCRFDSLIPLTLFGRASLRPESVLSYAQFEQNLNYYCRFFWVHVLKFILLYSSGICSLCYQLLPYQLAAFKQLTTLDHGASLSHCLGALSLSLSCDLLNDCVLCFCRRCMCIGLFIIYNCLITRKFLSVFKADHCLQVY